MEEKAEDWVRGTPPVKGQAEKEQPAIETEVVASVVGREPRMCALQDKWQRNCKKSLMTSAAESQMSHEKWLKIV